MKEIKRCERCYTIISRMESSDWFSHMSIKYCDKCREEVKKEQNRAGVAAFRKRKKEADRAKDEQIRQLQLENEILRARLAEIKI